jgi:outer membrane lipoprotein-sorting protein
MLTRPVALAAVVAMLFAAAAGQASAQAKPGGAPAPAQAKAALPSGAELLAKCAEALGGQAAFDKIKNRVARGTLDLGQAGVTLAVAVYSAKPDRIYMVADSDVTGRIETGVVDGLAWENSAMRGAIVKEGVEKADAIRDATFDRLIYWKDTVAKAETSGTAEVDGKTVYKVVVTPKVGAPQTVYFDRESSLVVQLDTTMVVGGQSLDIVSKPSDYRVVDGIKSPFKMVQYLLGQERVLTLEKVEHNVDLPADRFEPPAAIKAIAGKR